MNIRVQGPDGVILEFPAGTDPGVMKSAMQKRYGGPQQKSIAQTQAMPDTGSASTMDGFLPVDTQGAIAPPQGTGIGEELRRLGRSADDAVRVGANAMTFGLADRFAGAMTGKGTEGERAVTKGSRERLGPVASTAIDIAGGVLPGVGLAKAGITAARAIPQARLLGRLGAGAVDGAALGAANALGYGEDVQQGALMGGAGGGAGALAGEVLSAGMRGVGSLTRRKPSNQIQSRADLKQAADEAYKSARNADVLYSPEALSQSAGNVQQQFANLSARPELQPKAFVALRAMQEDAEKGLPVTPAGLDSLRQIAGDAFDAGNLKNNALTKAIANEIDTLTGSQSAAISGNAQEVADALMRGRQMHSQGKKYDEVSRLLNRAEFNAESAGAGANIENQTRGQLKQLLRDEKYTRGYTQDEKDALREAVLGTPLRNTMRGLGKAAPNGVVSTVLSGGAGHSLGAMVGMGPLGMVAVPAAGYVAKKTSDAMTDRAAQRVLEIILAGGKKEAAFGTPNMLERMGTDNRDAIVRALMMSGAIAAPGIVSNR